MTGYAQLVRNVRLGVKDLMLHKLRSFLTMLGMVFGVGSVVAMLAVGEGASEQVLDQIRRLGSHNIIITSVKPTEDEQATSTRQRMVIYGLLYDDETRIRESLDSVRCTVPVRLIRKDAWLGERRMELRAVGTTPDWFRLVARPILAGRAITAKDVENSATVCVLTETGARRLLATRNTIGQTIRIGSIVFEVIGIVRNEEATGSIQVPDLDIDAYIPLNVCRQRFGEAQQRTAAGSREIELVELHQIIVEVRSTEAVESTAAAIEAAMRRFHKRQDYKVSVPLALLRQAEATRRTFNIVLGSIGGISLLVGGIGIMNIMLASVTERTREIGIRRAIGARRGQIVTQFLIETVVLSCLGGLVGLALGVAIPTVVTKLSGMPSVVRGYTLVLSFGISVAVGMIFGLYPAVRAANLDPIEALRHD